MAIMALEPIIAGVASAARFAGPALRVASTVNLLDKVVGGGGGHEQHAPRPTEEQEVAMVHNALQPHQFGG